ncbi:MAG: hypothetical protein IT422_16740 [Pirellulaceae bacterium]|nr:hypothetical protein [Pirellulaceae bacterium]
MEKILANHEWFHPISRDVLLEDEFESQILAHAPDIFPGYRAVPFKQTVSSPEFGNAQPDFLIFEANFRAWWVIEVEMSRHSLSTHVEPQVAALSHGKFNKQHILRVASAFETADEAERAQALMASVQANVLVIVDSECEDWRDTLKQYDASLITVKPYQSRQGKFLFRQIGMVPGQGSSVLSSIQIRRDTTRAIIIDNRAALPFEQGQEVELLLESTPTRWRCHFLAGTLMLFCLEDRFPIDSAAGTYVLVRLQSGEYSVEKQVARIIGRQS